MGKTAGVELISMWQGGGRTKGESRAGLQLLQLPIPLHPHQTHKVVGLFN